MFPERPNPYEKLIEQFLENVDRTSEANEQRFVRQREERLTDEERAYQRAVRERQFGRQQELQEQRLEAQEEQLETEFDQQMELQRQQQATVDAREQRRREQQLTDAANTVRQRRAQEIRESLAYLDPGGEEYQRANSLMNALLEPTSLTGQEAFNQALSGRVVLPDEEAVNANIKSAEYSALAREAKGDEETMNFIQENALSFMANGAIPRKERARYYDNVIQQSDLFTDDVRNNAMSLIGINDPEAQRNVRLGNDLAEARISATEAGTALTNVQAQRERLGLKMDEKLANVTYEQAVQDLENSRYQYQSGVRADFFEYGYVPEDEERAGQMARSLGFDSVDDLRQAGRDRYERVQRMEAYQEDLLDNQVALVGEQVDMAEVNRKTAQWQLERAQVWSELQDRTNMATTAFAAAAQGDVATLQMLQGLQDTEMYGEALANIDFDALMSKAETFLGSEEERREFEAWQRHNTMRSGALAYETDLNTFVEGIGQKFQFSDFTRDPETGVAPVEEDVDQFLSTMSDDQFTALGTTREELKERLLSTARRNKVLQDRSEASAALEALQETVPHAQPDEEGNIPTQRTNEQEQWRRTFMMMGEQAGLDPDVIEQVAEGLLSGSNMDFWRAKLDAENVESQIRLNQANARATEALAEGREAELAAGEEEEGGVVLDKEQYDRNLDGIETIIDSLTEEFESSYCQRQAPAGGSELVPENREECLAIRTEIRGWREQVRNLTNAYNTGSPWAFGALGRAFTTDPVQQAQLSEEAAAAREELIGVEGVHQTNLDWLSRNMPDHYSALLIDLSRGDTPMEAEAVNEILSGYRASADEQAMEESQASMEDIDTESKEWRDLGEGQKIGRVVRTREFQDLAMEVAEGRELDYEEKRELARQFGFSTRGLILGPWAGPLEGPGAAEVPTFEWALDQAVRTINRQRGRGGQRQQGQGQEQQQTEPDGGGANAPDGAQPQAQRGDNDIPLGARAAGLPETVSVEDLAEAVIVQESGGAHTEGDDYVTNPTSGAFGIAQSMPITAWRPGFSTDPLVTIDDPEVEATLNAKNNQRRAAWQKWRDENDQEARQTYVRLGREMGELIMPFADDITEEESRRFANQYLAGLLDYYNGDVERALAAYNAGHGTVNTAVNQDADDWLSKMLPQTQNYVPNVLAIARRQAE